jgi:cohesin complex subunit SA-1/2
VVDDWIDSYKQDRETALLALMQFFISAAGCRGRITNDMQASMEHSDIIRRMTEVTYLISYIKTSNNLIRLSLKS